MRLTVSLLFGPGAADRTSTPGAKTSTVGPQLAQYGRTSSISEADTVQAKGDAAGAKYSAERFAFPAAAATNSPISIVKKLCEQSKCLH